MKVLIITFVVSIQFLFASAGDVGTTVKIKEGGAVSAFSKDDGFKLSDKALSNLGISFKSLKGSGPWIVPKSSLVRIKHSTGVYRKWNDWITMVLVKVIAQNKDSVTIRSIDLQSDDDIAVSGVAFLRMTDADLNSDTVDSCSH